jgi:hypothetical protein
MLRLAVSIAFATSTSASTQVNMTVFKPECEGACLLTLGNKAGLRRISRGVSYRRLVKSLAGNCESIILLARFASGFYFGIVFPRMLARAGDSIQ